MAFVRLYRKKLRQNFDFLDRYFKERNIDWAIVTKLLCGNMKFLKEVLELGIKEVCDSRLSNLKMIKQMAPHVHTVYIKPPPKRSIPNVVKYADVSFNTESETIALLSREAVRQGKVHKVTIMIELGDLREGIMGESLLGFYDKVFNLPNIEITSIGANLNCLHGVLPSQDKLIQLGLYKQLIEVKFNKKIPWVTGGTSVVFPLLARRQVPKAINHFRIGETLYFGNNLLTEKPIKGMTTDVFHLYSEIIELTEKPMVPIGEMAENPSGETFEVEANDPRYGRTSFRAILDIGLLDIAPEFLIADDPKISIVNASSDMMVVDLGETNRNYQVGDLVSFRLKYMGLLRLMNSPYIGKEVV
jgi:predicted amino acid racemase